MNSVVHTLKRIVVGLRSSRNVPSSRFRVVNLTRNTLIATDVEIATSSAQRSKGLLGRSALGTGEGLWIVPCESVHTFAMRFAIDLIYLDKQQKVRKICSSVRPWRISACLTAHSVLELAAGVVRDEDARPGDILAFTPVELVQAE